MKVQYVVSMLMTFLMLSSIGSAVEIRGTVSESSSVLAWNAQNFAGFYYDIDNGLSSESLTINDTVISDRSISENNLVYQTGKIPVNFSYYEDTGKLVDGKLSYDLVGWQAEKWVALNGKTNKLVKLITEFEGTEKVTLTSGGSLTLGKGYVLKINSVDAHASPRQAWVSIMKDGETVDNAILPQGELYNLQRDVGGEKDALVFSAYVSSIFSGSETEMLQLQYIWLIDESTFVEIKSGSKYGVFEVSSLDPITLRNDGVVSLSKDSNVDLMGNMKFKIADSDILRFYPYVEIIEEPVKETKVPTVVSTPVNKSIPVPCEPTIVEKIVEKEKIVYVNVTVTPEPTPKSTNVIPGFEAIFAIAGLLAVTLVVLRKRKD